MPLKDMATSTGTYGFLRTLGGSLGVAVGQAIWSSVSVDDDLHNVHAPDVQITVLAREAEDNS